MNWKRKIFKEHIKETIFATVFSLTFALVLMVANFFFDWNFDWEEIDPIEMPPLWIRGVASFFTWFTLGNWLFNLYFYKVLYWICKLFGIRYSEYKKLKQKIWVGLMLLVTFVLIPLIVDILNSLISILFNIFQFLISTIPYMGISATISAVVVLSYIYITKKEAFVIHKK
ncbi:hypothetical protein HOO68_04770 [Candidatus Gracilibacteria bacterium]|nr:hypothetical protein [Candidatus Gracilibacteria bacterium]